MTEWIWQTDPANESGQIRPSAPATLAAVVKHILYREQDNWFLWVPVALALGISAYFNLLVEPSWFVVAALVFGCFIFIIIVKKHTLALSFSLLALAIATGFSLAKVESARIAAPVIQKRTGPVVVKGRIETLLKNASGEVKLILRPYEIDRIDTKSLPRRLRLKLRRGQSKIDLVPGQTISARAIIFPPPEPIYPGGFDFARKSWFEGVGGSGFLITSPGLLPLSRPAGILVRAAAYLARLRQQISNRLKLQLGDKKGGLAAALLVGDRAAIPGNIVDSLRDAGLAHLLAISGLHMMLFAGTIFWLLRAVLALNATLVLHWPVKKWAAAGALAGAVFYLAISGATIATQRAFIMIMIIFISIMLDRPAISLRNIAIAAILILIINPYSLLSISFQMSFAATTCLVAFYEGLARRRIFSFYPASSPALRVFFTVLFYIAGTALTTLIAGLATSAFAAYYFQRVAVFSLLANVLALPVIGIIVMPAGLAALILMPLGFDGSVLTLMGAGLDLVMAIADWTAALPDAVQIIPAFSSAALLLMVLGALWLCLWQTRWRFYGVGVIAAGIALVPFYSLPDVYVTANAKNVAARGRDGRLSVASTRREKYSIKKWLLREGDHLTAGRPQNRAGFNCDDHGCILRLEDDRLLGFARDLAAVEEDCQQVDILIAQVPIRQKCIKPVVTIDRFDLWRNGAYTISFTEDEVVVRTVREERGDRPWVRKRLSRRKKYDTARK